MKMLDTNICSYIIRGIEPWAGDYRRDSEPMAISAIVAMELRRWVYSPEMEQDLKRLLISFLEQIPIRPFDLEAATSSAGVAQYLFENGTNIGCYDPLIAGHAISENAVLVTNNEKDFRKVPMLRQSRHF